MMKGIEALQLQLLIYKSSKLYYNILFIKWLALRNIQILTL